MVRLVGFWCLFCLRLRLFAISTPSNGILVTEDCTWLNSGEFTSLGILSPGYEQAAEASVEAVWKISGAALQSFVDESEHRRTLLRV